MDARVWGPHFWFVLHLVSFNYPDNPSTYEKDQYKVFYYSIQDILPCPTCRQHYKNYLSQFPITTHLDTRADLIAWVIQIHNFVNSALGKPVYSVDQILNLYANLEPASPFVHTDISRIEEEFKNEYHNRLYIFIGIFVIIIAIIIYLKRKYYFYLYN